MASAHHNQASSSKHNKMDYLSLPPRHPHSQPLKKPGTIGIGETDDKNPNPTIAADHPRSLPIARCPEDVYLSKSSHLMRAEVLRRRLHRLKQLSKCYRDHHWALMEELRVQYRAYVWKYGLSPFKEDEERETAKEGGDGIVEGSGETNANANANANNLLCAFYGCKLKAMALTSFCNLHILSDSKQKLYKPCDYVIKSAQAGPITCGKPILQSTVPSLCSVHFQKAQKHVTRALKKAGLNVSSSNKLAPKFHVIVAEYVHQIQAKRRAALRINRNNVVIKQENAS